MFQQNSTMSSIIGPDLEIKGDINIKGDLLIYGIVDGNINCQGLVTTAKGSEIKGYIKTINADISGSVYGNLEAKEKISISSTAQHNGDIIAKILVIEEGASFNGLCTMNKKNDIPNIKSSNNKVANLNEGNKK